MRPSSSIGRGRSRASPSSTSSPANSRASSIESSVAGFSTSSTTTFEADNSMPVSGFQSTWMSSPDLNCFLAAARTASFMASMTRSRSMPCSWQSASMFCAMDELMKLPVSGWLDAIVTCASLSLFSCYSVVSLRSQISDLRDANWQFASIPDSLSPLEFRVHIHFEVCLRNYFEGNSDAPVGSIINQDVFAVYSEQATAKIALAVDRLASPQFRQTAGEALVVSQLVEASLNPR